MGAAVALKLLRPFHQAAEELLDLQHHFVGGGHLFEGIFITERLKQTQLKMSGGIFFSPLIFIY